jgi:hypothetical protein
VNLDSSQFNIFFNVVRNLLLAPPPPVMQEFLEKGKKSAAEKDINISRDPGKLEQNGKLDISKSSIREELRETIEQQQHKIQLEKQVGSARSNELTIGKGTWTLFEGGSKGSSIMNVTFTGLNGSHIFHENRCTTTMLEVQMFTINQENPGLDAQKEFGTQKEFGEFGQDNSKLVMSSIDHNGAEFDLLRNNSDSCRYHCDVMLKKGEWTECWSCCDSKEYDGIGCHTSTHQCKKPMFSLSIQAYPSVRIVNRPGQTGFDDVELGVINALSVSIFPEARNKITVQIAETLSTRLKNYFSISDLDKEESEDEKKKSQVFSFGKSTSGQTSKDGNAGRARVASAAGGLAHVKVEAAVKKTQEAVYIKYMRVGDITVVVSTAGFLVKTKAFEVTVDPFVLQRKVYDWGRLFVKVKNQAISSVTRHTLSNWGSSMFFFSKKDTVKRMSSSSSISSQNSSNSTMVSPHSNEDQEEEKRRVLLGPGASTSEDHDTIEKRKILGFMRN